MASVRIIFKRHWRTPLGRYDRSMEGVPTLVPKSVLDQYPLPSDALIVDDNYVAPRDRAREEEDTSGMTVSERNAEIDRRVNAIIAQRAAEERGRKEQGLVDRVEAIVAKEETAKAAKEPDPVPEPTEPEPENSANLLDGAVSDIKKAVEDIDDEGYLAGLLAEEESGKNRKGVVISLQARLEDLSA